MSENIVFEADDTLKETAIKTVYLWAGTNELKKEMQKLGINYTKTQRGIKIIYILRHNSFGKIEVTL